MMAQTITIIDVMSFLVENRAPNLPPKALAEVFDKMIWCIGESEAELLEVQKSWLAGDDPIKIEIALLMDEVMPHSSKDESVRCFSRITTKWPHLKERCDELLIAWDKISPKS